MAEGNPADASTVATLRIQQMIDGLAGAREEVLPSAFWTSLNKRNVEQIESGPGYENFKQTVARNYYTWVMSPRKDAQTYALMRMLPRAGVAACVVRAMFSRRHAYFRGWRTSFYYNLLTHLLWEYVSRLDTRGELERLHEPEEGNPPRVYRGSRLITQDLAQSFLEYRAIASDIQLDTVRTIMELGAGYGRTAFVFLSLIPSMRYFIVDIPPALYICERYLCSQFAGRKIFRYRPFADYAEVKDEMENADLIFLLPSQLELLPDRSCDLFVNISSLHEMKPAAIRYYFQQIGRLTAKYFYFKQWKTWRNPEDDIVISEADYPVSKQWQRVFWRECPVQTRFFEAMFRL
jgi:putative sugar O-methyltransferase